MDAFLTALSAFSDPYLLMVILIGTLGGVLVGAMPGLSSTMATALLLPFTLTMDPIPSMPPVHLPQRQRRSTAIPWRNGAKPAWHSAWPRSAA